MSLTSGNASNQNVTNGPVRVPVGFEWKSRSILGIPLICVSFGRDERGRRRIAKGLIAVGNYAIGGIAIGQFALGLFGVGQFAFWPVRCRSTGLGLDGGIRAIRCRSVLQWANLSRVSMQRGSSAGEPIFGHPAGQTWKQWRCFGTIDWLVQQDFATICETLGDAFKFYCP